MIISGYSRDRSPEPSAPPPGMAWKLPLSLAPDLPSKRLMPNLRVRDEAGWMSAANVAGCPTSAAFLARTSGLDATHVAAYNDLICGLVTDGLWTKLDVLYIFATQDSTTALLNLVSTSYNGTAHDLGTNLLFVADRSMQGTNGGTAAYIDTGFNPTTAVAPNFTQNSAHVSVWNIFDTFNTVLWSTGAAIPPNASLHIKDLFSVGYGSINDATNLTYSTGVIVGQMVVNRSAAGARQIYMNKVSVASDAQASTGVPNGNLYSVGSNNAGTPNSSGFKYAAMSIGSSLSSGDVTLFYNRLRTYLTAVGVP